MPDVANAYPAYGLHAIRDNIATFNIQLFDFTEQLP